MAMLIYRSLTGINGFSGIPTEPEGQISLNVNLIISPGGKVGIEARIFHRSPLMCDHRFDNGEYLLLLVARQSGNGLRAGVRGG